jgi:hypothetical protein
VSTSQGQILLIRSRWTLLVVAISLGLAGCTVAPTLTAEPPTPTPSAPAARDVDGFVHVALTREQILDSDDPGYTSPGWDQCSSSAGFADVAEGAQITATDADGKIVGVGTLGAGHKLVMGGTLTCGFAFTINDIVLSAKFYSLSVGNVFRGELQFTEEDMRRGPRLFLG